MKTLQEVLEQIPEPLYFAPLPELKGTEKQVNWANKIRHSILADISARINFLQWSPIFASKEKMAEYVKTYPVKGTADTTHEYGFDVMMKQYKKHRKYIALCNKDESGYWIDNRTDSTANFRNAKFRRLFGV